MTKPKLKACPFCGSTHASEWQFPKRPGEHTTNWQVICWISALPNEPVKYGCGSNTGDHCTKQEAIAAWNRRAK